MQEHFKAGITTLDTADIYGPSESIVGNFVKTQPAAVPCTKFCCFRFLDEIDRAEVKARIKKVSQLLMIFLYRRVIIHVYLGHYFILSLKFLANYAIYPIQNPPPAH
jgi:hypothetical protein